MKAVQQKGFTLVELVVVIVILGILAAVALPKFVDLGGSARTAALSGVSGALASSTAINYASRRISPAPTGTTAVSAANVCTNAILGPLLQGGVMTTGYTAGGTGDCSSPTNQANGNTVTCTLTDSAGTVGNVSITCSN